MRLTKKLLERVIKVARYQFNSNYVIGELRLVDYFQKEFRSPVEYSESLRCLILTNGNYYVYPDTILCDLQEIMRRHFKDSVVVEIRLLLNYSTKRIIRGK